MRILYLNAIQQNAGWGAEWFLDRAFRSLGHFTHCIDFRVNRYRMCRRLAAAPDCDVLFTQKGDGLSPTLIASVQRPRFYWACEVLGVRAEHPVTRQATVYNAAWQRLPASGVFDHLFLRTPDCVETAVTEGWVERKNCSILRSGFEPTIHRPIASIEKDIDVLFVGSMNQRRNRMVTEASERCEITVAAAYGSEMIKLLNRAKIVLNMHISSLLDTETRVYEVLGCRAFLLSERLSAENPFSEADLAQFDSIEEMVDKVRYYLEHEDERQAIAWHGHLTALKGHTYADRARQILGVMAGNRDSGASVVPMVRRDADLVRCGLSEYKARLKQVVWVLRQRLVAKA